MRKKTGPIPDARPPRRTAHENTLHISALFCRRGICGRRRAGYARVVGKRSVSIDTRQARPTATAIVAVQEGRRAVAFTAQWPGGNTERLRRNDFSEHRRKPQLD